MMAAPTPVSFALDPNDPPVRNTRND